uniref:Vanadium-binding protein n=1 Tax=Ascidia sydneiensis samea TaxID=79730 RepID=B1B530_ASCSS|nr:vanadium-binding protein [Ascidia sydneiensis samea]
MKFVYAVVALCLVLYLAVESDALGSDAQSHNNELSDCIRETRKAPDCKSSCGSVCTKVDKYIVCMKKHSKLRLKRRMRQCLNKYTERIQILVESVHHDLQECGHCLLESRACKPKGECGEVLHDRHDDH